ncbi:hypothetical protein [Gorillibacterium sp. sgz500922]|uniref:hypothetical protein n=1 Tax=Gorillibacterium sp. sgz500922 TaxID=3446694 RepID=UPI003F667F54
MSVQITIAGEDAGQALQDLATLSAALIKVPAAAAAEQPEAPKATRGRKAVEKPAETKPAEPTVEPEPETTDDDTEAALEEGEDIPDDVKLRAAASAAADRAGRALVKELLGKYGVPNVTALPDGKRSQFLRDLEGLK